MLEAVDLFRIHQDPPRDIKQLQAQTRSQHLGDVAIDISHLRRIQAPHGLECILFPSPSALLHLLALSEVPWQLARPFNYFQLEILLNNRTGNAAGSEVGRKQSYSLWLVLLLSQHPWQDDRWNLGRQ